MPRTKGGGRISGSVQFACAPKLMTARLQLFYNQQIHWVAKQAIVEEDQGFLSFYLDLLVLKDPAAIK